MGFREWAMSLPGNGTLTIDEFPLDALHPLRHGRTVVTLDVRDGVVQACRIDVHAHHRGDEKLLEVRDVRQGLALVDRHGWLTAPFAEVLYARIAESMLGIMVPPRALALRGLALALNAAAVDAYWEHLDASLDGRACDALRTREELLHLLEGLTGARMHTTYARIGGVAADADTALLDACAAVPDARVADAARSVRATPGAVDVALPKVVRLPQGDAYDELATPHGVLGMWVFSKGDKVPHRVHLRTAGFAATAALEREAIGLTTADLLVRLARTRCVPGEVAR